MPRSSPIAKIIKLFTVAVLIAIFSACATTGAISTIPDDGRYEGALAPSGKFFSPLDQVEITQASETDQNHLEQELAETGEVALSPDHSYSFDIESYCLDAGLESPVNGDELNAATLRGPAQSWLPKILSDQGRFGIPQKRVQYLIWALIYDVRFDELSNENQQTLIQFFPDAAIRFGNRRLEDFGKDALSTILPSEITSGVDQIADFRAHVLRLQDDYKELERVLAPRQSRDSPIRVGWMRAPEGYFLRLTAAGYTNVRVDIYVPGTQASERSPQSVIESKKFRPSRQIGIPARGQRLALSSRSVAHEKHKALSMTPERRKQIIEKAKLLADPGQKIRYSQEQDKRKGPDSFDCSGFVQTMYHAADLDYPDTTAAGFQHSPFFEPVSLSDAQPGDVIQWLKADGAKYDHVGVISRIDFDGTVYVIAAGSGGRNHLSELDPNIDPKRFVSSVQESMADKLISEVNPNFYRWK